MFGWSFAFVLAIFRLLCCASGAAFLRGVSDIQARAQQIAFLAELEDIFGSRHREATEARLAELSLALQPTFTALPKNAHGAVSASAARYAIHRVFVHRHGWHIKGLKLEIGSRAISTLALGLGNRLPKRLLDLIEDQQTSNDFYLHEMVLLSATIETLIHGQVVGRLNRTYAVLQKDVKRHLSEKEAMEIIDTYMTTFLLGYNVTQIPKERVLLFRDRIVESYIYWAHYRNLMRETQHEVAPGLAEFSYGDILKILEVVNERVGRRGIDAGPCREVEASLIRVEEAKGTGRVTLLDFYESYLDQKTTHFRQRIEYLREQGVLDESEPSVPRVIIPNYLSMQEHCLNVSTLYDVCCINKCEGLLGHLESKIQAPSATPGEIIRLVSALPSADVPGNRTLSATLVQKLHDVAEHHSGQVPLHGRLFAQWMHFAYPRACPYPHLSGKTTPMSHYEWSAQTGMRASLTPQEMDNYIESSLDESLSTLASDGQDHGEDTRSTAMWVHEEELVDAVNGRTRSRPGIRVALVACVFLVALLSFAPAIRSLLWRALTGLIRFIGVELWLARLLRLGFCRVKGAKFCL